MCLHSETLSGRLESTLSSSQDGVQAVELKFIYF